MCGTRLMKFMLQVCLIVHVMQGAILTSSYACEGVLWEGLYCTDDLSGYRNCYRKNGEKFDNRMAGRDRYNTITKCPEGTKCGCFLDRKCESIKPCVTATKQPDLPDTYTLTYSGTVKEYNPGFELPRKISGMIIRDANQKTMLVLERRDKGKWKAASDYYEFVVPNAHGKFQKVTLCVEPSLQFPLSLMEKNQQFL